MGMNNQDAASGTQRERHTPTHTHREREGGKGGGERVPDQDVCDERAFADRIALLIGLDCKLRVRLYS